MTNEIRKYSIIFAENTQRRICHKARDIEPNMTLSVGAASFIDDIKTTRNALKNVLKFSSLGKNKRPISVNIK